MRQQPAFTCSKSTMEAPEQCVKWCSFGVFIVNFEQILRITLVPLLLTFNK